MHQASHRLTEEVHTACLEISAQGDRPTSLTLLNKIGRGSLTTITKYRFTACFAQLPEELSKDREDSIKKSVTLLKALIIQG